MKATEFRIGNYVFWTVPKNHTYRISADDLETEEVYCVAPIPLTEEWLLKLGLEGTETDGIYKKDKIYCDVNSFAIELNFPAPNKVILTQDLKFVHQLQNLYFALTGNELTLTPKEEMK